MNWKPLLLFTLLVVMGIVLKSILQPQKVNVHAIEPLADPQALQSLIQGRLLEKPTEEPYGEFHDKVARSIPLVQLTQTRKVLGLAINGKDLPAQAGKWIAVDLTNQRVYAFEKTNKVFEFTVSTGKWAPTPTGEFTIWAKVRSQKMEGGSRERHTYYYLPNVPYVMFFYNDEVAKMRGFSLHGTYWHNNFGHPMSHGCINMKIEDARVLYDWADPPVVNAKAWSTLASKDNPGTKVVIYGETPRE